MVEVELSKSKFEDCKERYDIDNKYYQLVKINIINNINTY